MIVTKMEGKGVGLDIGILDNHEYEIQPQYYAIMRHLLKTSWNLASVVISLLAYKSAIAFFMTVSTPSF